MILNHSWRCPTLLSFIKRRDYDDDEDNDDDDEEI